MWRDTVPLPTAVGPASTTSRLFGARGPPSRWMQVLAQLVALPDAEARRPASTRAIPSCSMTRSARVGPRLGMLISSSRTRSVASGAVGSPAQARLGDLERAALAGSRRRALTAARAAAGGDGGAGGGDPVDLGRASAAQSCRHLLARAVDRRRPVHRARLRERSERRATSTRGARRAEESRDVGDRERPGAPNRARGSAAPAELRRRRSRSRARSTVAPSTTPTEPSARCTGAFHAHVGDDPGRDREAVVAHRLLRGAPPRGSRSRRARTRPCRAPRRGSSTPSSEPRPW